MCDTRVLVPIPVLLEPVEGFDATHPEFGIDAEGRRCFMLDACIVPAVQALWSAGIRTRGCCCGHGQQSGGVIALEPICPSVQSQQPISGAA